MRSSIASGFGRPVAAIGLALCGFAVAQGALAQAADAGARPVASPPAAAPQQSDPRRVTTVVTQVMRLQKEGKPDEALQTLEAGLKQAPRDPQLRFLYGVIVAERGRRDDAIAVFEQLSADFPELPEPYNNLAVMYAAAGDLDKARAALENAVRALPAYALAHENLGDLYVRMSARAYERALAADSRSAARTKLSLARELLGRIAPNPTPAAAGSAAPGAK